MGLFDLFKRDISNDPDLTRLRDLIIISASDNNYSVDENSIILDICREEGIDIDKLQKLFKMDPEKIKDNYPSRSCSLTTSATSSSTSTYGPRRA